ncbi:hypothetical protein GCM10011297_24640 [Bacterioplanes sanyensis]|uniref:alpha/beta hydrolase n=1 Tax=Bacterioplanes sanyensis TaxID=1249553 RepID=UPI00167B7A34|nr:alpha/beta hydrolase [Bacterioplanes sanyensis]GGY50830.1 hypothetical protein GCM10011297_24640 [Bacterioplanes sanyensis]
MQWDKTTLVADTPTLDWQALSPALSEQWRAYCDHYRLAFSQAHQHSAGKAQLGGFDIVVQYWQVQQPKGVALLVHGYYDHVGLYRSLIEFCLSQQLNVVCFDLPGHGLSSGEVASIDDFRQYDDVFSQVLSQVAQLQLPIHVFGQSTGGAIILHYLLTRGIRQIDSPFAQVNLLAPLIRPTGWRSGKWIHGLVHRFVRQIKRKFKPNSANAEFLRFVAELDPLQPRFLSVRWVGALKRWIPMIESQPATDVAINIVQGDCDRTVDWRHNLQVLEQKFPRQRRLMVAGGQHHLVNESAYNQRLMFDQLAEWMSEPDCSSNR